MKIKRSLLKQIIREELNRFDCSSLTGRGDYYYPPEDKDYPIEVVQKIWIDCGMKLFETTTGIHAVYTPEELWPYREYDWTPETASGTPVTGIDGNEFTDKWSMLPDEEGNLGFDKWKAMADKLKKGWLERDPAIVYIGKNAIKVGEGNHRLAVAKQIGLKEVPVRFIWRSEVQFNPASNVKR